MIHRELAAYHNYTPRMVLFRGVVFLILDIGIISVVNVPQNMPDCFSCLMRLDDVLMKIFGRSQHFF